MIRDTIDGKRRPVTQLFVVRNHKPLHGWLAMALFWQGRSQVRPRRPRLASNFARMAGNIPRRAIASHAIPIPGAGLPRHLVRNRCATSARAVRRLPSRAARSQALSHRPPA